MHAEHRFRPLRGCGDLVDVEVGGVGRQDRAGLADRVELAEDLLLDRHQLEHGLDDEVAILQVAELQRAGQKPHPLLDVLLAHAAFLGRRLVVLADGLEAALQRLGLGLDHRHRQAGVEEVHGDAAAHRAGADDADALHRQGLRILRHVGDAGGLPLGEEHVALRRRLRAFHQRHEKLALVLDALVERHLDGSLHRLDALLQRLVAAELAGAGLAKRVEDLGLAAQRRDPVITVAYGQGLGSDDELACESHRTFDQVALDDLVEQALRKRRRSADRRTRGDHLQGPLRSEQTRQALGATGARQQAELDLG